MQKYFVIALNLAGASLLLCGSAHAQQPSTTGSQPASTGSQSTQAAKPPAPKSAQSPAAKSTTGTAAKPAAGAAAKPATAPALTTDKQKGSYAVGINIGNTLKQQPIDLDLPSVLRGIQDARSGVKPLLTEAEMDAALKTMRDAAVAKVSEENMKEGEAFLTENKTKDGVVTTASGLQYKILTAGSGPKPAASDTVVCNYKGTLVNGTEFDSSYKRGQPAEFPVGRVIPGWTEALQMMPVGSKWQLFVPANLAYGMRSPAPSIPPNSTLIFEVELISIKAK